MSAKYAYQSSLGAKIACAWSSAGRCPYQGIPLFASLAWRDVVRGTLTPVQKSDRERFFEETRCLAASNVLTILGSFALSRTPLMTGQADAVPASHGL